MDHGVFVFPDSSAKGEGDEQPQHCYNVVFTAPELWGSVANPKDRVYVDLFDDYLDPGRVRDISMIDADTLAKLPLLPRDQEGPVFVEPWQAQAFTALVRLVEEGSNHVARVG